MASVMLVNTAKKKWKKTNLQECQHHHLLIWKNRMTKKMPSVCFVLTDFHALWHLRRSDKEKKPKSSVSSGPYTHL